MEISLFLCSEIKDIENENYLYVGTWNKPFSVEEGNSNFFLYNLEEREDLIGNIDRFLRSPNQRNMKNEIKKAPLF
jgi:hypothetical protein